MAENSGKIAVFLAMGFEEIEALTTVDILRRAELQVETVGVGGPVVRGAHGVSVLADVTDEQWSVDGLSAVVLPGGMPGTLNLERSPVVQGALDVAQQRGLWIGAICAAPSILGHRGLLEGRTAVCFPGFEGELKGARLDDRPVVRDGRIITGRGAGVAVDFALCLAEQLASPETAEKIRAGMQCR